MNENEHNNRQNSTPNHSTNQTR